MNTNYRPPKPKPAPAPRQPDQRLPQNRKKEEGPKINEEITSPKVRLVGDNIPEQGIYALSEALRIAESQEFDLVEISPNADPPVCRVLDYQKYLYQQKKKAKEQKVQDAFPIRILRILCH